VIESSAKDFEAYSKLRPLDISESLSQGMGTIVAGQIDGFTPGLHHAIDGHHGEGLVLLSGLEKVIIVLRILGAQEVTQSLVDFFVDDEGICLFGLGLSDLNRVSGLEVFQVRDFELEQVSSSDSIIDAEGKKQQVSRSV
jgi:hypothetical protein